MLFSILDHFSSLGGLCGLTDTEAVDLDILRLLTRGSSIRYLWMRCYLMMTFTGFVHAQPYLWVLFWVFLQPSDDFEACFYAAVGEFSNLRTKVWLPCPPNKQASSPYLKDKFEHILHCIYLSCKRSVPVIWLLRYADVLQAFSF